MERLKQLKQKNNTEFRNYSKVSSMAKKFDCEQKLVEMVDCAEIYFEDSVFVFSSNRSANSIWMIIKTEKEEYEAKRCLDLFDSWFVNKVYSEYPINTNLRIQ